MERNVIAGGFLSFLSPSSSCVESYFSLSLPQYFILSLFVRFLFLLLYFMLRYFLIRSYNIRECRENSGGCKVTGSTKRFVLWFLFLPIMFHLPVYLFSVKAKVCNTKGCAKDNGGWKRKMIGSTKRFFPQYFTVLLDFYSRYYISSSDISLVRRQSRNTREMVQKTMEDEKRLVG